MTLHEIAYIIHCAKEWHGIKEMDSGYFIAARLLKNYGFTTELVLNHDMAENMKLYSVSTIEDSLNKIVKKYASFTVGDKQ